MAKKNFLVHLDMNKQELQNAKVHNLTTAARTTLAASLLAADKGLFVYDTDLLKLFVWNGTAFTDVTPAAAQVGQYRGGVAHTAAEPANLASGDWVTFTSAGVVTNFGGTQTVQIGDWAIYNGTTWDILQGNVDLATETTVGLVQLASSAEAIAGTNATKAITPATLEAAVDNTLSAMKFNGNRTLTANVPENIVHSLGGTVLLTAFNDSFEPVELQWVILDNDTITVTSNVSISIYYFIIKID